MEEFVDEILITTLKFWIKKIRKGDCTREQEIAILNALDENHAVYASVDEISALYGKSKDAVNGIIKRRYPEAPKRNVALYSLSKFRKCLPKGWRRKNTEQPTD